MREGTERRNILHGRHENSTIHDEVGMRHYYAEWGKFMEMSLFKSSLRNGSRMKRGTKSTREYIKARIPQLMDDMNKATDPDDKQWYNRIIQELTWAYEMQSENKPIVTWNKLMLVRSVEKRFELT